MSRFVPTMVTTVPAGPPHGEMNVMVGEQPPGFALVNLVGLLAVALALVTWILPLASPATVAQTSFPETILNADTGVPPISTLVTIGSLKFVPLITTTHPAGPLVGENDEMVGGAADAGASRPSTTRADTTATAATPSPECRLKEAMPVLTSCKRYSPIRLPVGKSPGGHCCRSRSIPTSTARSVRSSSQSIRPRVIASRSVDGEAYRRALERPQPAESERQEPPKRLEEAAVGRAVSS